MFPNGRALSFPPYICHYSEMSGISCFFDTLIFSYFLTLSAALNTHTQGSEPAYFYAAASAQPLLFYLYSCPFVRLSLFFFISLVPQYFDFNQISVLAALALHCGFPASIEQWSCSLSLSLARALSLHTALLLLLPPSLSTSLLWLSQDRCS